MKFGLIGAGQYAKRNHIPHLKNYGDLRVVCDKTHTEKLSSVSQLDASKDSAGEIAKKMKTEDVDACIVSTPPQVRKEYILRLLEENIPVYCDKPLTFPKKSAEKINKARKIWRDYKEIQDKSDSTDTPVWIHAQKRYSKALSVMQNYVEKDETAPLHYLEISKADGQERTPAELENISYHGFIDQGNMAHSAYHYVDYTMQLLQNYRYDRIEIKTSDFRADDFARNTENEDVDVRGELNSYLLIQAFKSDSCIFTAKLSLRHTGVSSRDRNKKPRDWAQGSGRVKQERILGEFGHDITTIIKRKFSPQDIHAEKHVESTVEVHKNPRITNKGYEKKSFADDSGQKYTSTRKKDFDTFINYLKTSNSPTNILHSHRKSIKLFSKICESLARSQSKLPSNLSYEEKPLNPCTT